MRAAAPLAHKHRPTPRNMNSSTMAWDTTNEPCICSCVRRSRNGCISTSIPGTPRTMPANGVQHW